VDAGERNLGRLIQTLDPRLSPDRYSFVVADRTSFDPQLFALIREEEGVTAISRDDGGAWARISLGVHSDLEAIGLTAALSACLARTGISANVVAGLRHDHIFVPWERRDDAMTALKGLSRDGWRA
jgi:hypothetical protein